MGKKPASAYAAWFADSRPKVANVKKLGEMWKTLPASKKQPYEDRAQKAKKEHDAYITPSKGAAVLKAYEKAVEQAIAPLKAQTDAGKQAAQKAKAKEKAAARKVKVAAAKEK